MQGFAAPAAVAALSAAWLAMAAAPPVALAADAGPHPVVQIADAADEGTITSPLGGYLAGRYAEQQNDVGNAATFLLEALEADPENVALMRRAFLLLVSDGRIEEALELGQRYLEAEPEAPIANLLVAMKLAIEEDYMYSGAALSELPRRGGNELLVPILLAWIWLGEGDLQQSMNALAPLGNYPNFATFHRLHKALVLDVAGREDEADASYVDVVADTDAPIRAVLAYISFLQRTERFEEAETLLRLNIEASPDSLILADALEKVEAGETLPRLVDGPLEGLAEALFDVASALHLENASRMALLYGRIALYLKPGFPAGLLLVATVLDGAGRGEEAIEVYQQIDREDAISWSARMAAASILDDLERLDEAVAVLESMAGERPERADPLILLGDVLRTNERFHEAVVAYDRALERMGETDERHWAFFYARGIALERSDDWDRAEADFLHALELQPDHAYILNYLGYSWVDRGMNFEPAMAMLERAMELEPDDGYITDSMGWVLYRLGKFGDAVGYLERAVELRSQDSVINDHLGDAYWQVGRLQEARFQWQRALNLDPDEDQMPLIEAKLRGGVEAAEALQPED